MTCDIQFGQLRINGAQCRSVDNMDFKECCHEIAAWQRYASGFSLPIVDSRVESLRVRQCHLRKVETK